MGAAAINTDFLLYTLIPNLLPAAVIGIVVFFYRRRPPKEPNALYGYRTPRSMASKEAWDYANKRSIFWLQIITLVLVVLGVLGSFTFSQEVTQPALYILMCVLLVAVIPIIENELRKRFNE
jgi:uncharacterized membrane protein